MSHVHEFEIPSLGSGSSAVVSELTAQFTRDEAPQRWGVYQGLDDGSPLSVVGTWIERTVFRETYGPDQEGIEEEVGPFRDRSIWSVIVHHPTQTAVGASRCLVGPSKEMLAARQFEASWHQSWTEGCIAAGVDPNDSFIEASSFAVLHEWRTADRMWPVKVLACAYMHLFDDLGAQWAAQVIDPRAKRLFESWGTPFVELGAAQPIKGVLYEPAVIPRVPGWPNARTKDVESLDLLRNRDERGRGGTALPQIDLDREPLVVRLDREVRGRSGEAVRL